MEITEWWEIHISGQVVKDLQLDINSYYGYQKLAVDGFFGPATNAACPTVHRGDVYKVIGELQKRLKAKGYYLGTNGTIDNSFGPYMESEFKRYQAYWEMPQDGILHEGWYHKLYEILG